MISICEYDNLADARILQERSEALLLPFKDVNQSGAGWKKMRERILARLLLESALKKEYGLSLTELAPVHDANGKPVSSTYPEIGFNISHCSVACACATGTGAVGVDIERKFAFRENLAKWICHPEEWKILQRLEPEEQGEQVHFLWSMKESFVKWDGKGIAYGMKRIDLSGYLPIRLGRGEIRRWDDFLLYHTDAFTLAAYGEGLPQEISCKTELELL